MKRIAVIGAGAAGLCAARHLSSEPTKFQFVVYEQQNVVGGTWCYTNKTGTDEYGLPIHSSMYENLRTNLPKEVMAFPDFLFPENGGKSFIHHSDVLLYLKNYATYFSLYKYIKFNMFVENVQPLKVSENSVIWDVTVRNLVTQEVSSDNYDAVMVCNGHYSVPFIPVLKGIEKFEGLLLHSHEYRNNLKFKNLKVVVLGAGASGIDIAMEVANVAKEVILSHNLPPRTCSLPSNLFQEPGIDSVDAKSVTFLNGCNYDCDAIILCTGYLYYYPFIHPDCRLKIYEQRVPLYKHFIHPEFPTLGIWAIPKQIIPFPIYNQQVIVYLKFLKGEIDLPSKDDMLADIEKDFNARLKSGMKTRHAHVMRGDLQWEYDDELSALGKISKVPKSVRTLFLYVHELRKKDVINYKNHNFRILDDETFIEI